MEFNKKKLFIQLILFKLKIKGHISSSDYSRTEYSRSPNKAQNNEVVVGIGVVGALEIVIEERVSSRLKV